MNPPYSYQNLAALLRSIPKSLVVLAVAYALIVHAALASPDGSAELPLPTPSPAPSAVLR